jgi:uncharacterized protein (TIGR03067 family)
MDLMRLPLFLVALLVLSTRAVPADDRPIDGELAKLQGTWSGKTGRNGIMITVWTIKKDILESENTLPSGKKVGGTFKLVVDGQARPHKTIDSLTIRRDGGKGSGPDRVVGIYEFVDKDTIRVCNGAPDRPSEFKAGAGGLPVMFTLKRLPEK